MATPDISDLLEIRNDFLNRREELRELGKRLLRIENEVIQRYKSECISEKDCDHPVTRYAGGGEDECLCCGKYGL